MLENLRTLRNQYSVTQKQLADVIGVSQQSINKYENHAIEPDIETLKRIAEFFNTSIDYLVGYSSIPHRADPLSPHEFNVQELTMIGKYRALTTKQRQSIDLIIENYIEK